MRKLTIISLFFALISSFTIAAEVNIFSARHYDCLLYTSDAADDA